MHDQQDLHMAELLCSRLCHELVSPIGAVNNGVELIRELDASAADEALELIADSGQLAARRVQFFRMAYGSAGVHAVGASNVARNLCQEFLSGGKVRLEWLQPSGQDPLTLREGLGKLLLNLTAVAAESLPRGGSVTVRLGVIGDRLRAALEAEGTGASLPAGALSILGEDDPEPEMSPQNVHLFLTRHLASRLEGALAINTAEADSPESGRILFEFVAPAPRSESDASG